ncbi:hypothetical protein [Aromatoleum evansii]|uniref:hypothetical protein n=1 Tax=Aromatoleum evansii TaxID=59406 RepID=UPI00145C52FB|nr:hypothetical protein [Aromatoleum evansii]NMG31090.1 hypothetical protein [Aromatoleum evansii]
MAQVTKLHSAAIGGLPHLRLHDLIAKTSHVRLKETLRVLVALKAVAREYDMSADAIVHLPYSLEKPSPPQWRQCEIAYLWMYDTGALEKYLFEIEQIV